MADPVLVALFEQRYTPMLRLAAIVTQDPPSAEDLVNELPSGINRVVITVHSMSGDSPTKTLTDPVAIATLRESVNRLPRIGKGARRCVTDRGTWTLTFTGRGPRTTMTFDATGCNEVQVRIGGEPAATRQGNDALRTQLTDLIS